MMNFYACSTQEFDEKIRLVPTQDYVNLPLDTLTSNLSDGLQYVSGEKPLLFFLNWANNSLQVFDLEEEKRVKELKFDYEGPNGVMGVSGFYVHNLDSIFLFNQRFGRLYLANFMGEVYSAIRYQSPENYTPAVVQNTYFTSMPILVRDRLIVKTRFHGQINEVSNEELKEKELMYAIDLSNGTTQLLGYKFPENYLVQGSKYFDASICYVNGEFVVSYFSDHNLYYTKGLSNKFETKMAKSEFVDAVLPNMPTHEDPIALREYAYASPHYETIFFDEYRKLLLRFVFHAYEMDRTIPMHELRNYSGPFSIQIFDENLNFISETGFKKNTYHPFDFFVNEKGLYLSTNHPLNPDNKENFIKFELIKFDGSD